MKNDFTIGHLNFSFLICAVFSLSRCNATINGILPCYCFGLPNKTEDFVTRIPRIPQLPEIITINNKCETIQSLTESNHHIVLHCLVKYFAHVVQQ